MGMMSLSTLALAALATAVAVAALALVWKRSGGRLRPLRILGVLVCEALLMVTVGLVVNRVGDFYPSWTALTMPGNGAAFRPLPPPPPSHPGAWLSAHPAAAGKAEQGLGFDWAAGSRKAWGLEAPPVVHLPEVAVNQAETEVPLTIVLLPPKSPTLAIPRLNSAVVVLRLSARPHIAALTAGLPAELRSQLPVLPHSWAAVGVGSAGSAAVALTDLPEIRALALLPGTTPLAPKLLARARSETQLVTVLRGADTGSALAWADRMAPAGLAPGYILGGGLPAQPTYSAQRRHR
jgi:hypothetical protein